MNESIPKFSYNLHCASDLNYRCITIDGRAIHWIEDAHKFYKLFGLTPEIRKTGILPEEFICNEYTNNRHSNFTACMQIQIIEYLRIHSREFMQKHGNNCGKWITALTRSRAVSHAMCLSCKMASVCSN
jgi:hypothetical protein